MQTPLESFTAYKAESGMQCGSYSIDLPERRPGEQYRFHFDATKCVGCRCCEVACNEQNNNPADVKWRRVGEMEGGTFPDTLLLIHSMSCNHCLEPACLVGCPTESYIKLDNGIVFHDDDACIGCQYCTWNCPYGAPVYHAERGIVTKCHMCHERLEVGQSPACVQACPAGAIEIELFDPEAWQAEAVDREGNIPESVDARVTVSTTRYTLPAALPQMTAADAYQLKPFHPEWPLVFMTVLTQMSLGGFFGLMMGDVFSLFGGKSPNVLMALLVLLPAAAGLPLSALHLGRPGKALSAMKNIKSSWLSREALALGVFAGLMTLVAGLYFLGAPQSLRLAVEALTLGVGIYGIYAQGMIYRIAARPSWNRATTQLKFFGTAYTGLLLLGTAVLALGQGGAGASLITAALGLAVAQGFFTYEDRRDLERQNPNAEQLGRTKRLYDERFATQRSVRDTAFVAGALLLPLLCVALAGIGQTSAAMFAAAAAVLLAMGSELLDRFLFYVTSVPLQMAGGFFVGKQR